MGATRMGPGSFPWHSTLLCVCALTACDAPNAPQVVEPKRQKLAEAEAEMEIVMAALRTKQAQLKEVMDKLAELDADLTVGRGEPEGCAQRACSAW